MTVVREIQQHDNGLNALLADYAAGRLSPALHGLVAGHLELKRDNRAFVSALESLHAQEIEAEVPAVLTNRDAMLTRIFGIELPAIKEPLKRHNEILPRPVSAIVGDDLSQLKWRSLMPGLKEYKVKQTQDSEVSMLWIHAGRAMPSHTHEGTEVTLVLKGGFSDASGHYCRGDIAIADAEIDHRPRADDGEDCICFVVNDAGLRLTGPFGRLFQRFTGH